MQFTTNAEWPKRAHQSGPIRSGFLDAVVSVPDVVYLPPARRLRTQSFYQSRRPAYYVTIARVKFHVKHDQAPGWSSEISNTGRQIPFPIALRMYQTRAHTFLRHELRGRYGRPWNTPFQTSIIPVLMVSCVSSYRLSSDVRTSTSYHGCGKESSKS